MLTLGVQNLELFTHACFCQSILQNVLGAIHVAEVAVTVDGYSSSRVFSHALANYVQALLVACVCFGASLTVTPHPFSERPLVFASDSTFIMYSKSQTLTS